MSYFKSRKDYTPQKELEVFGDVIIATMVDYKVGDLADDVLITGVILEGKFPVTRISSLEEFMQRKNASGAADFPYFVAIKAE